MAANLYNGVPLLALSSLSVKHMAVGFTGVQRPPRTLNYQELS